MPIPPFAQPYRSSAIPSMAEFFGVDASDVFEAKEAAEGYLAGTEAARKMQQLILSDYGDRSRLFRENFLNALREQL